LGGRDPDVHRRLYDSQDIRTSTELLRKPLLLWDKNMIKEWF
jgi:hypothetical protein